MLQPLSLERGVWRLVMVRIGGLSHGPWYERQVRCMLDSFNEQKERTGKTNEAYISLSQIICPMNIRYRLLPARRLRRGIVGAFSSTFSCLRLS